MTKNPSGMCSSCKQSWATRDSWDALLEWINANLAKGYIITDASYSQKKNQYVMVMTESPKAQATKNSKEFPKEWVKEQWEAGRTITKVMYKKDPKYPDW